MTTAQDHSESRSEPVTPDDLVDRLVSEWSHACISNDLIPSFRSDVRDLWVEATQSANTRLAEQEREIGALHRGLETTLRFFYRAGTIEEPTDLREAGAPEWAVELLANPSSAAQARDEQVRREALTQWLSSDAAEKALANAIHDVDDDVQFIRRDARNLPVLATRILAALAEAVK